MRDVFWTALGIIVSSWPICDACVEYLSNLPVSVNYVMFESVSNLVHDLRPRSVGQQGSSQRRQLGGGSSKTSNSSRGSRGSLQTDIP